MRLVWAAFCGTALLLQVIRTASQTTGDMPRVDCSQLSSCNGCISGDPSLNLTRCVWRSCSNGNNTQCISETEDTMDCIAFNDTAMCSGKENTHRNTHPPPEFSQATFDLSSFIGGIILVLALQSGAFFAMRFLKTKDSSYETM
ncbi:CD164 sialomucin-like 2 protein [Chanos chanos]|uniref:CD164 sialomucin-like 2 protein n=1 Tax=Chanos chanos TaxID=29144 RepID=A0A6J2WLQ2_CHACN|nr:CD164 sialomucin-like 2 protein [Chanos chanos]